MNKLLKTILVFVLFSIYLVIGMILLEPDTGISYCTADGDWCLYDLGAGDFSCSEEWKLGLPKGELILIIPKTLFVGKQNQMIGLAYSPSVFSRDEIEEKKQRALQELKLKEKEADILKVDIFMDVEGYPRIPIFISNCSSGYNRYVKGENLHIDPEGLTIWNLFYSPDRRQLTYEGNDYYDYRFPTAPLKFERSDMITVEFVHDDPEIIGTQRCSYMCDLVSGRASATVQVKHTIFAWIVSLFIQYSPLSSLLLVPVLIFALYLVGNIIPEIKIKKHPKNQ